MVRLVNCESCDGRDRPGFMTDGECRDCQEDSVGKGRSDHATEANDAHAEDRSRHRVVANVAGRGL